MCARVAAPWLRYLQTMRIDTHHHVFPAPYLAAAKRLGRLADVVSSKPSLVDWTPAQSLDVMDRHGVQTAIVSISTPGVWWGNDAEGRALARACNESTAEMVRAYPGRYGFFASIPLPDVDGSLAELAYALDVLGANGIVLMTNYGDRWPGDPDFAPFFAEVGRRKTAVFFHPTVSDCCRGILPDVSPSMIEYPFDSTRAIVSLLCSGTFSRYPDIRWIFSHGGGALPMVADRIVRQIARPPFAERVPRGGAYELGKLYFDVAAATSPPALHAAILRFAGINNVLLGTDFPFGSDGYRIRRTRSGWARRRAARRHRGRKRCRPAEAGRMTYCKQRTTRNSRGDILRGMAVFSAGSALLGSPLVGRAQSTPTLRVGTTMADDLTPVYYALRSGMFKRAGLEIDLNILGSGGAVAAAVVGGALDIGHSSLVAILTAHAKSIPIVLVAAGAMYDEKAPAGVLVQSADSNLRTGRDLSGKTIGVSALGDFSSLVVSMWTEQTGGDPKSLRFVENPAGRASPGSRGPSHRRGGSFESRSHASVDDRQSQTSRARTERHRLIVYVRRLVRHERLDIKER